MYCFPFQSSMWFFRFWFVADLWICDLELCLGFSVLLLVKCWKIEELFVLITFNLFMSICEDFFFHAALYAASSNVVRLSCSIFRVIERHKHLRFFVLVFFICVTDWKLYFGSLLRLGNNDSLRLQKGISWFWS